MRITKLEHAALVVEEAGRRLVIDPGSFTSPILGLEHVDAVVVTHEHPDHWNADQLQRIRDSNRGVTILGPAAFAQQAEGFEVRVVRAGERVEVAEWTLEFFGGDHAIIHPTIPLIENLAVLVNGRLYDPGDSFFIPVGVDIDTLAVPASAPWMRIAEAMDFIGQIAPQRAFGIHDAVLSAIGRTGNFARLQSVTEARGGRFFALETDDVLDV